MRASAARLRSCCGGRTKGESSNFFTRHLPQLACIVNIASSYGVACPVDGIEQLAANENANAILICIFI
jgi:hypothetical protein